MDPFLGIGMSARACVELGVDFTGFEIDPAYFEEACASVRERVADQDAIGTTP